MMLLLLLPKSAWWCCADLEARRRAIVPVMQGPPLSPFPPTATLSLPDWDDELARPPLAES
jgi:hypothetical protein